MLVALCMTGAAFAAHALAQGGWLPLPDGEVQRIAFGSCAKQWEPQPIWNAVVAADPDVFLFLGDVIYGDWHGKDVFAPTADSLKRDWGMLPAQPAFQFLRRTVPVMATWDNHDYGKHDGGAEFALKETSREIFLDFFGEPSDSERRQTPGIYDARVFGPPGRRVQVILLDTRSFKGPFLKDTRAKDEKAALNIVGRYRPNRDPNVTLLGDAQWLWLEEQLRQPAELRLIVSSTQVVTDEKGMDEWGNYPRERRRLFVLIGRTGATGVILLSGNVHYADVSRTDDGPYPLYDFTSSGLTHTNPAYAKAVNSYRVAGPFVEENFGLVEIDWDVRPHPVITFKAIGADGSVAFEHQLTLDTLQR